MSLARNFRVLHDDPDLLLVECFAPQGVYRARHRDDGSIELLARVEFVEHIVKEAEELRNAIEELRKAQPPSGKASKSAINVALSAALAARGKSKKKGATDWPEWVRAKKLLAEGRSIEEAADLA